MIPIDQTKVDALNEKINPTNKIKKYNTILNQGDLKTQWYQCSLYASAQNLSYNCGITLTEADLDIIAERQNKLGLFSYTEGARGDNSTNAVLKYVKEKGFKVPTLMTLYDDEVIKGFIKRGYLVITGIMVNTKFKTDVMDGKIDTKDYKDLAGTDLKHYLNLGQDGLVDNYFLNKQGRPNIYKCDADEVLQDISQHTKFIFIY